MSRLLIINESKCSSSLAAFISRNKKYILLDVKQKNKITFSAFNGLNRIVINTVNKIEIIAPEELLRLEGNRNYSSLHFTDKRKITLSKTLRECETAFISKGFIRVHKSHMVNLGHISSYSKKDGLLNMRDGSAVPVSIRKKKFLFQELEKL